MCGFLALSSGPRYSSVLRFAVRDCCQSTDILSPCSNAPWGFDSILGRFYFLPSFHPPRGHGASTLQAERQGAGRGGYGVRDAACPISTG